MTPWVPALIVSLQWWNRTGNGNWEECREERRRVPEKRQRMEDGKGKKQSAELKNEQIPCSDTEQGKK